MRRVLDAGRVAGSSRNSQPWRFVVAGPETVAALAPTVWEPGNLEGAALVVAVVVTGRGAATFDAGRAAQNMMLVAWDQGVGSCPNGVRDSDRGRAVLGLGTDQDVATILSFGYPAGRARPGDHSAEEWAGRADRKPREAVVEHR